MWLAQFEAPDLEMALKVLENVDYYTHDRIIEGLETLGEALVAKSRSNLEEMVFAGFTTPGKSGDWMISDFRLATGLKPRKYDGNFINLVSLSEYKRSEEDESGTPQSRIFVFLDDYIGSGDSAIATWGNIQSETNLSDKYYLATLVATEVGAQKIKDYAPSLEVVCADTKQSSSKVFHPSNAAFSDAEKTSLRKYCEVAYPKWPTGFKDTQSLTVFCYRCPNNVIAVLYGKNDDWTPLFPRVLEE